MVCEKGETPLAGGETEKLPLRGLHVLVVDDEPSAREMYGDVFALAGARVTLATSARQALALVEHDPPDVLISDIMMPGKDGYWLIENVIALAKTYGPWRPRAVAIAVTGDPVLHSATRALRAGFDAHLGKPVDLDVLQATVLRLTQHAVALTPGAVPQRMA